MRHTHILALAALLSCLCGCGDQVPEVPALVQGASASGGVGYDCRKAEDPTTLSGLANSPELSQRLQEQFPTGSNSDRLEATLVRQGFVLYGPCSPDGNIRWAQFRRNRNEVVASVYWRVGVGDKLMWTFGDVAYAFL